MDAVRLLEGLIPLPLCDWDGWSSHSSSTGSADPVVDAFAVAILVAIGIGVLVSFLSGGLLIVFTRRIRDMFWAIPAVNLAVYLVFLLAREYPGGREAQFRGRGLAHTLGALALLLVSSLILASVLALLRSAVRRIRSLARNRSQPRPPAPPQA